MIDVVLSMYIYWVCSVYPKTGRERTIPFLPASLISLQALHHSGWCFFIYFLVWFYLKVNRQIFKMPCCPFPVVSCCSGLQNEQCREKNHNSTQQFLCCYKTQRLPAVLIQEDQRNNSSSELTILFHPLLSKKIWPVKVTRDQVAIQISSFHCLGSICTCGRGVGPAATHASLHFVHTKYYIFTKHLNERLHKLQSQHKQSTRL